MGSKLPGAALRVAALLHLASDGVGERIGLDTIRAAVTLADYFTAHALAVCARTGADPTTTGAERSLDFLATHPNGFTEQEFYRNRFPNTAAAEPVLRLLETHDYIRRVPTDTNDPRAGRPGGDRFGVNLHIDETNQTNQTNPPRRWAEHQIAYQLDPFNLEATASR